MQPHGIMFHHFHNDAHPRAQGSLDVQELRALLAYIGGRHAILGAEEFLQRAEAGTLRGGDICLTFDDSLRCQFDVAFPVLESLGLTAFWFLYTSPMQGNLERLEIYRYFRNTAFASMEEFYDYFFKHLIQTQYGELAEKALAHFDPKVCMARYAVYSADDCRFRHLRDDIFGETVYNDIMDGILKQHGFQAETLLKTLWIGPEETRALRKAGHVVGLHSHTHPTRIQQLPPERQLAEYVENKRILEGILDEEVVCMSHPSNSYGPETLTALERLGVRVGFRAIMTGGGGGALEIPRQDHANIMREMRG